MEILFDTALKNFSIDQTIYTQPALFALEYALVELWKSWGIEPNYVLGHSVGEYIAAYVAGVFSLEDGLRLVTERGRLMQEATEPGKMVTLFTDYERVLEAIQPYQGQVSVALINGPQNIVISGVTSAIEAIKHDLYHVRAIDLVVSHAFHSPLMEPILPNFQQIAKTVALSPPTIGLVSNITGKLEKECLATPAYWCQHIRETVHFEKGLRTLLEQDVDFLIEIGPKPILLGLGQHCDPSKRTWLPSLQPPFSDWQTTLHSLAQLHTRGVSINWTGFEQDYVRGRQRIDLPSYPFQRRRYWFTATQENEFLKNQSQEEIVPHELSETPPPSEPSLPLSFLNQLTNIPNEQHYNAVRGVVQDLVCQVLRYGNNTPLPLTKSLKDLGLDSLMSAELITKLDYEFKVKIPIERMLSGESLQSITSILLDKMVVPDSISDQNTIHKIPSTEIDTISRSHSDEKDNNKTVDFHDAASDIPQIHAIVTAQRERKLKIDGRWVSDFASCNYLGLDLHPEVMQAIPPALEKWGTHPSWTRAVASPGIYEELELALAELLKAPSVLAFPAVTLLHAGVIPILVGYDGVIFKDISAHRSIYEACLLAQANGADRVDFKHNDAKDLEEKLKRYPLERNKLIAIDGVYSMSGAYPPLPEFARLARTYNATVYLDDAHGLGIVGEHPTSEMPYGQKGNGIVNYFGLDYVEDRMIYVAGLSKSYSSFGACITCTDASMRNKIKTASTFIFSGPSPVASLASALEGIRLNQKEGKKWRRQIYQLTNKLVIGAKALGFDVVNDNLFPIVGVVIGQTPQVICRL